MQRQSLYRNFSVYGIFTVSGASALIYQIIWSRWLSLSLGTTTASVSIVLGCFMIGLALGSHVAGRVLHRVTNVMRWYAVMELGIGSFALIFPWLFGLGDTIFSIIMSADSSPAYSLSVRAIFSFLLLMVPTTFMGATLPLLTEYFRRNPRRTFSFRAGLLYAANTLGAAIGIIAASFVLIELAGVSATNMIAAFMNFSVAFAGFLLSRRETGSGDLAQKGPPPPSPDTSGDNIDVKGLSFHGKVAIAVLTGSGAVALASEVLWTRTLETLVGNSTYAFATIVLLYLVGIALGSWLMALFVNRLRQDDLPIWLAGLQLAMGAWGIVSIILFERLATGIATNSSAMVHLAVIFLAYLKAMLMLMPLSLFSGACFPLAARMLDPGSVDPRGEAVARAYSWNTIGAVAGSLTAGFIVAPRYDYFNALFLLAFCYGLICLVALLFLIWFERKSFRRQAVLLLPAGIAALVVIVISINGTKAESCFVRHIKKKSPGLTIPFHKPGMQGVVTVVKLWSNGLYDKLLVNGIGMTVKATDTKIMAHLPLLIHPNPENVLVICFGMGTTYRSAVSHGRNVTVVELVPEVFEAFPHFYADADQIRAYPRGRMIVNDGRNFLKLTREKFDVITIDPPPPIDAAGVVNLYSREFIELARSRLKDGGIMAHWYPFVGTGSGVDDRETFMSLVKTFSSAFPCVYIKQGYNKMGLHVIGAAEPVKTSPSEIEMRYYSPPVAADLLEWDPVPLDFFSAFPQLSGRAPELPDLTDDNPYLEFYLLRTLRGGRQKMFPISLW